MFFYQCSWSPLTPPSQIGTPVMREVVFGDIGVNPDVVSPDPCGGSVPAAGALVLTFLLNNYQDPEYQRLAQQWEKEVKTKKQYRLVVSGAIYRERRAAGGGEGRRGG